MSRKVIAIVTLGQGSTAYYDEITGMHLTLSNPTGYVYEDIIKYSCNRFKFCI